MKLPEPATLEIILDFMSETLLVLVLGTLVGMIAVGKVEEKTSYGLSFIAGGLTAIASGRASRRRSSSAPTPPEEPPKNIP